MWVWLGVGVAGYLALMCVVVLVLRAAKARNAAERAADAHDPETPWYAGPPRQEATAEDAAAASTSTADAAEHAPSAPERDSGTGNGSGTTETGTESADPDAPEAGDSEPGVPEARDHEAHDHGSADATPSGSPGPCTGDDADSAPARSAPAHRPHPGSLRR